MKRVHIYLLGALSFLFAITSAQAQSQRLDSLLRVSDAIGAKQRAIVDEMMKNYEEMRACKTNEQVLAKLAERQAMDKRAEKLSAEARRVEEEVRVERARLELIERDDKLVKKHGGNIDAAKVVGEAIAKKALAAGVECVVFDRGGFLYHGRIAALADAAREAGLMF